jgi:uncharacterized membrane protein
MKKLLTKFCAYAKKYSDFYRKYTKIFIKCRLKIHIKEIPTMKKISKFLSSFLAVTVVLSQGYKAFALTIPTQTIVKKSEFRAVWMPTTYNIDWPQISSTVTTTLRQLRNIKFLPTGLHLDK